MSPRLLVLVAWALALALVPMLGVGTGLFGSAVLRDASARPLAAPDNSLVLQPFLTSGLSSPVLITNAGDGSNRLFVVEQGGKIKVVSNGQILPTPFLDVTSLIVSGGEQGLLGLAFHPQFKTNGLFYIYYTAKPLTNAPTDAGDDTLVEYQAPTPSANVSNATPVRTLLDFHDRFSNHNGGDVAFGPDGFLYVAIGDEGTSGDPDNNSQNLGSPFGKMFRIDVDSAPSPGFTYAIPAGNPFIGVAGARPDIWAYGFRNPWRWSFDRLTGNQMIGDVGQNLFEEIDVLPKNSGGMDFGWRIREGAHCYNTANPNVPLVTCQTAGLTDPVLEYDHTQGCAVIGGFIYRGPTFPSLQGTYFYADECSGKLWRAQLQGSTWVSTEALDTGLNPSAFGEDETGEVYLVNLGGAIYRITPLAPTPTPTLTLTPTQTLTPTATLTPTVGPCSTRPRVGLQVTPTGAGTLDVLVSANDSATVTNNTLASIAFGQADNALVTAGGRTDVRGNFTVPLTAGTKSTHFTVRRTQAGLAMRVDLTVNDLCGGWQTFVGAGTAVP
jgi:glucose/arabinose dehydrogenase